MAGTLPAVGDKSDARCNLHRTVSQVMYYADAHTARRGSPARRDLPENLREAYAIPVHACTQQIYPGELGRHGLPCCSFCTHAARSLLCIVVKALQELLVCCMYVHELPQLCLSCCEVWARW